MSAADRIAETILQMGNIRAQGLERAAQAQAEAQRQSGQIWGGALAQLGQLPGEIAKYKLADTENQIRQNQLQQQQKIKNDDFNANQIFSYVTRPDETGAVSFDESKLPDMLQKMAGANVSPEVQNKFAQTYLDLNKVGKSFRQDQLDHQVKIAHLVLGSATPEHPLDTSTALATLKWAQANGIANPQDVNQFMAAVNQGHQPADIFKGIIQYGAQQKPITNETELAIAAKGGNLPAALEALKPTKAPEAAKGVTNETELELAAQDPNHPQHAAAVAALAARPAKEPKPPTSEEDKAKAVTIRAKLLAKAPVSQDDRLWLQAHEAEATLTTDKSASAAADRQAATLAQQNTLLSDRQKFDMAQAARKEYSEKIAQPYQTALASSQTLRDTVEAAKGGNMVAANLQNLETAMSAIRAQGLNRINTTEIGVAANAGSLWDRVQAAAGKLSKGQPVDPALQSDILKFADILDKSATLKYQKTREGLLKTYTGVQLPDESVAAPAAAAAPSRKVGDTITYQGRQRKVVKVYPDGSVDLAK